MEETPLFPIPHAISTRSRKFIHLAHNFASEMSTRVRLFIYYVRKISRKKIKFTQ